jgi:hypothetical protein
MAIAVTCLVGPVQDWDNRYPADHLGESHIRRWRGIEMLGCTGASDVSLRERERAGDSSPALSH